jgi:hypothetical protein
MKGSLCLLGLVLSVGAIAFQMKDATPHYRVLMPISQGNVTVFPVVASTSYDTGFFLTLDEGIKSGQVVVTEAGGVTGLVRPRPAATDGVWRERQYPQQTRAQVNQLSLINNADRPLLLLAGEIVTGGKQDRIVGKDRIIPAHSTPVALGVFCVEPHRWTETSTKFGALGTAMAQPSIRLQAMAQQNQQGVWAEVAKSRAALTKSLAPPAAAPVQASSSYAMAMKNQSIQVEIDSVAKPLEHSYDALIQKLRAENAVGAVVAVNGEIIWADVFASSDLLNRFWPKLIRSYAAESFGTPMPVQFPRGATVQGAQDFLDRLGATHESVETEPGLYRQTEISGDDYTAFVLTSLLPGERFDVHIAKMKR